MINTEMDFTLNSTPEVLDTRAFTLNNHEIVKLTLNFELLLKVKNKYPDEYENFSKYVLFGDRNTDADFFDLVQVIYVAYLCANIDDKEKYTKEEFIKRIPMDIGLINRTQKELLGLKKK